MSLTVESVPVPLQADEYGVMRVGKTRVRLDTVITAWKQGESPEQIADDFDALTLAEVYAVISYYLQHQAVVEQYLAQNRQGGEQMRAEMRRRFPVTGLRERLLARRAGQSSSEQ